MELVTGNIRLWTCPKCGRQFERKGQTHSCRSFPLEQHFEGKPNGKKLYEVFRRAVKDQLGPFKIESLECCIHFVSTLSFAAIKICKDKIRIDFSLTRKIKCERFRQTIQISAHRFLYIIDITGAGEIDTALIDWIKEARDKKISKIETGEKFV